MIRRFGAFFLLIGTGLVLLFVLSDLSGSAQITLLAYGLPLVIVGIILRIRGRQVNEPKESRFRTLRRLRAGQYPDNNQRPSER